MLTVEILLGVEGLLTLEVFESSHRPCRPDEVFDGIDRGEEPGDVGGVCNFCPLGAIGINFLLAASS